jgi:hypothetical protein
MLRAKVLPGDSRMSASDPSAPNADVSPLGSEGDARLRGHPSQPILVTGMHRSGTSWVGKMLCAGGDFIQVSEPLNVLNRQTILSSRVERWYTYICRQNEGSYLPHYREALAFQLHPFRDIRKARLGSPRDPVRILKRWASFLLGRIQNRALLIRDPFAVVSLNWFAERLGFRVVVVVRHPLAVISSLKRLDYTFDFKNLLDQPLLINDRLGHFRSEIEAAARAPGDVVDQGCLLWRIIHDGVAAAKAGDPSICVVRHEDLSLNPIQGYAQLYDFLELSFGEKARAVIDEYSRDRNPKEVSVQNPFNVALDSRANLTNWKRRLADEEIERILKTTRSVAEQFYPDEGPERWRLPAVPNVG